jgi:hypothetical protein
MTVERQGDAIVLDSGRLRVVLLPGLGAKIYSIVHLPTGKELLWHNPSVAPAAVPAGSGFDDHWAGGWDELFPNDESACLAGDAYPDHGELWTARWDCEIERTARSATVYLRTECPAAHCRVEKWIEMEDGEPGMRFRHRLTNLRNRPLPYLWKLHPALAVSPGDRILIPANRILLEPEFLGTLAGRDVDLSVVPPPDSGEVHFFYGVELTDGWCGTYDPVRRLALEWTYPKDLFTSCWLFASYGGWRGHYVAVLEPCTAYPYRLEQAAACNQCSLLPPLGTQEASVTFSVRENASLPLL